MDKERISKEKIGILCKKILIIFLVSMVILTFLSRAMDAVTVAKAVSYTHLDVYKRQVTDSVYGFNLCGCLYGF